MTTADKPDTVGSCSNTVTTSDTPNGPQPPQNHRPAPEPPTAPRTAASGQHSPHDEAATPAAPVTELRAATAKLRALAAGLPTEHWGDRPWHTEECSDTDGTSPCPCIVAQGEYQEFDQPQIPPVQYVADAETPAHAAYIAAMHPGVAILLAKWLDLEADVIAARTAEDGSGEHAVDLAGDHALALARLIHGEEAR